MDKILGGIVRFHESLSEDMRPGFAKLVKDGQAPRALFITCADSRIVPSLITSTDPGDLFIIRNIGNLVPTYEAALEGGGAGSSVAAAIEYSLEFLKVRNIIVCGHSDCGALKAVQKYKTLPENSFVRAWMANAEGALRDLLAGKAMDPSLSEQNQLAQLNVLLQLEHLRTYPLVRERIEDNKLDVFGLFLNIEQAEVQAYHPGRNRFIRIDADVIKELNFMYRVVFHKVPEAQVEMLDPSHLV